MANSYMDDVKVKISERYKPPCRISLPMSYSQRLTLNKQLQDNRPSYDFHLERSVLEKLKESKESRKDSAQQRKQRLDIARNEFNKRYDEETKVEPLKPEPSKSQLDNMNSSQNYVTKNGILMPIPVTSMIKPTSDILKPMGTVASAVHSSQTSTKPFNLSDFESDASPFDNMELKSINDLEELAEVLKSDRTSFTNYSANYQSMNYPYGYNPPMSSSYSQYTNQYIPTSNYQPTTYNSQQYYPQTPTSYSSYSISQQQKGSCKSDPDLIKSLENTRLINHAMEVKRNQIVVPARPKSTDSVFSKNGDVFDKLTTEQRKMCRNVSTMGFPLDRVARVCGLIGDDQKKIVEHLLALSELLDLGFPESQASEALLKNNNDRDKALDLLIS